MNWKFWQRPPAGPRYYETPRVLTQAQQDRINVERLLALAGLGNSNPVWKAVLAYADEHAMNEQETALQKDLTDATRHYNAGRAASALDFAQALRDLRHQADQAAAKHNRD